MNSGGFERGKSPKFGGYYFFGIALEQIGNPVGQNFITLHLSEHVSNHKSASTTSEIILLCSLYRGLLTTPLPVGSFMTQKCSSAQKRYLSTIGSGKGRMVLFCDQFRLEVSRYKLVDRNEIRQINVYRVASHCYGASKMQLFLVKLLELE